MLRAKKGIRLLALPGEGTVGGVADAHPSEPAERGVVGVGG